jgi:hypothetical protein
MLVSPYLGLTYGYLKSLWLRSCRSSVSARAEAHVMLAMYPDGHVGKWTTRTNQERYLRKVLGQALFMYLRLEEHMFDFEIGDPVPKGDAG